MVEFLSGMHALDTACAAEALSPPGVDEIEPQSSAFFFDFDGVLAPIAPRPELVKAGDGVIESLTSLNALSRTGLVLVSGRPIHELDRYLAPLRLPAAGVHGLELRLGGEVIAAPFDKPTHDLLIEHLAQFANASTGLLLEPKRGSVALHYRARPELEEDCVAIARDLAHRFDGVELVRGKMVAELRLGGRSKGTAVEWFMAQPGFAGRKPIFVGDDVTDEDGFAAAMERGGHGFKVGDGTTGASHRFAAIEDFWAWLAELVARHEPSAERSRGGCQRSMT